MILSHFNFIIIHFLYIFFISFSTLHVASYYHINFSFSFSYLSQVPVNNECERNITLKENKVFKKFEPFFFLNLSNLCSFWPLGLVLITFKKSLGDLIN